MRGPGANPQRPTSLRLHPVTQQSGDSDQLPMSWPEGAPAPYAYLIARAGPPEPCGLIADVVVDGAGLCCPAGPDALRSRVSCQLERDGGGCQH